MSTAAYSILAFWIWYADPKSRSCFLFR